MQKICRITNIGKMRFPLAVNYMCVLQPPKRIVCPTEEMMKVFTHNYYKGLSQNRIPLQATPFCILSKWGLIKLKLNFEIVTRTS